MKNVLGNRIAVYRERLGFSQQDLAAKAGVELALVKGVEAGDVYPAIGVLTKLSRALGQRVGTFMDDQYTPDPIVTRASDRRIVGPAAHNGSETSDGFDYYPLGSGKTDRHMEPYYIEMAGDANPPSSSHEGEELIVVISGEVELTYGNETTILQAGDSAYYNSVVKHRVAAHGGKNASIYAAIFTPA